MIYLALMISLETGMLTEVMNKELSK
jgi:hypothetical protein